MPAKLNANTRELLICAADLIADLSSGQLKAVRTQSTTYGHDIGVSPVRLKALHDAVEGCWPDLISRSHAISLERRAAATKRIAKKRGWQ